MAGPTNALTRASTFVEALRARAVAEPDAKAFTFLDHAGDELGRFSYGELDSRARAIAGRLQALDLTGERALLACPPGLDCIAAAYGCIYAGVAAVPCPPPDPGREYAGPRIREIATDARPRAMVVTAETGPGLREVLGETDAAFLSVDAEDFDDPGAWREPGIGADDLALVQYTSGSTSVPRGVEITHANLLHNCEYIERAFDYRPSDTTGVMWLPPYHDMGLVGGILQTIYSGRRIVLMSPVTFLVNPIGWLEAIQRYRASVAGGPDFAYDMLVRRTTPEQRAALDLSSWAVAYNGAELIRRETMDAFSEAYAAAGFRREAFYPCYGLAEATLMVTGGSRDAEPTVRRADRSALESGRYSATDDPAEAFDLVGCGAPGPDGRVVIVDPESSEPLEDGAVGEIWVSGPNVARGYFGRDQETAMVFGARLAGSGEGPFLRAGDLGFVLEGELYITGRITELLIIDGRAFYPTDVERVCEESAPGLRHNGGAVFTIEVAGGTTVAVVYEVRDPEAEDHPETISAIRAAVAERLGIEVELVALIAPRTMPKTTSGKIQRGRCRGLLLNGELPIVADWSAAGVIGTAGPS